jgi:PhzF family phenazine biosynthesis protein
MRIPIVHADAFTSQLFHGNPAAVCALPSWLDDATLQAVATENNVSETAFLVGGGGDYEIRWMTPVAEVDLCGHATLASAYVLFREAEKGRDEIVFRSKSGPLRVRREGDLLALDFPSRPPRPVTAPADLVEGLGARPREVLVARDLVAVYDTEDEVRRLAPDFERLGRVEIFGVIATAPGDKADFVSRFFSPRMGLPEDPVTGSSHCTLVPYWSKRLGKKRLRALQVSPRGGELFCEDRGDRVSIAGRAVPYLEGTIEVAG